MFIPLIRLWIGDSWQKQEKGRRYSAALWLWWSFRCSGFVQSVSSVDFQANVSKQLHTHDFCETSGLKSPKGNTDTQKLVLNTADRQQETRFEKNSVRALMRKYDVCKIAKKKQNISAKYEKQNSTQTLAELCQNDPRSFFILLFVLSSQDKSVLSIC